MPPQGDDDIELDYGSQEIPGGDEEEGGGDDDDATESDRDREDDELLLFWHLMPKGSEFGAWRPPHLSLSCIDLIYVWTCKKLCIGVMCGVCHGNHFKFVRLNC